MTMLRSLTDKVEPSHTALLVIDVQNDFFADDGTFERIGRDVTIVRRMVPPLRALLDAARQAGVHVVFLKYLQNESTESEVFLEQRSRGRADQPICREGTWGADFYQVSPRLGEPVVVKHRYSGFVGTDLDLILRSLGVRTIVLTGVASNGCVEITARDGFMLDYYVVFADDCTASYSAQLHEATLTNITDAYGVVTTCAELSALWSARSEEVRA